MSTDTEWERWGKKDPYFAVITEDIYRNKNLTDEIKTVFFESGRRHISHVLKICRDNLDQDFSPKRALDFGCGTGRLCIPLAEIAEHVVGLDVSDSMLKEARKNCEEYSVKNVSLLKSDDNLSSLNESFDFIHSFIVFQHIPVVRGRSIFMNLLDHLKEGGIGAIQFTYSKASFKKSHGVPPIPWWLLSALIRFSRKVPLFGSRFGSRKSQEPEMEMNPYNVNEFLFLIQNAGISKFHVEFTDDGGELGVYLFFQKPKTT